MTALHVVLGAGQIGTLLAARLAARGHRVRQVRRSPRAGLPGLDVVVGDVADHAFAERACDGASVVYHCMNVAYPSWGEVLEPLAAGALHGAGRAGARLVVLDNLYHFGPSPNRPFTELSPVAPNTRKGALRARLRERYLAAHARGEARVTIARASDFYGPGIADAQFGDRFWARVLAGKPAECLGDPDLPHSYAFSHDVADALVLLGEQPVAEGSEWLLPHAPAPTTRDLASLLGRAAGLDVRVTRVPKLALRAFGLLSPMMRELVEMTYQWEAPFVVDDSRWRATFGVEATPLDVGAAITGAWIRARAEERAHAQASAAARDQRIQA